MFDTSAKNNYQINDVFSYISERLLEIRLKKSEQNLMVVNENDDKSSKPSVLKLGTDLIKEKAMMMKNSCCNK